MNKKLLLIVIVLLIIYIVIPSKDVRKVKNKKIDEVRGFFITYIELGDYIRGKSSIDSKNNIKMMINNIKKDKFNTIYLQVRSHMDSIYNSKIFPVSKNIILNDGSYYDVLDYFIKECHKNNILVYAWVNPYRIGYSIDKNSNYYSRVKDDIKFVNNMYYLNPASSSVTSLIVDGIKEIVKNYEVDGVLFDDYFYPSNDIDKEEYEKTSGISLDEFHLKNINNMVESVYSSIKKTNKNVLFGISPEGNIDNNYNSNFADVKKWGMEEGYVDFLIPQIYYGFNNSYKPFESVINEWKGICNKELIVALALYKSGRIDEFAKEGKNEWIDNRDIIKRQILFSREKGYSGFSIFRYDSFYNDNNTILEVNEIKKIM